MRKISVQLLVVAVAVALLGGLWMGHSYAASSAAPGSDQDPLVSKSYVDAALAQLRQELADAGSDTPAPTPGDEPDDGTEAPALQIVVVPAGKRLVGYEGSEFVLRSGNATIIASAAGGIPDLTAGQDLPQGQTAPRNHLLLIPRSDQRGIKASSQLIVMVRGRWSIEP